MDNPLHLSAVLQQKSPGNGHSGIRRFVLPFTGRCFPGGKKGFTLLEVLVALAALAVVMTAVFRLHAQTISMNIAAKFYTTAPVLAQKQLAEIELSPIEDISDNSGDFGDNFPGYRYSYTVTEVENEYLESAADGLRQIDLRVIYNEDEFVYAVRTYMMFYDDEE